MAKAKKAVKAVKEATKKATKKDVEKVTRGVFTQRGK